MLEHHLGNSFMEKEEIDKKTVIRTNWKKLIKQVTANLSLEHAEFVTLYGCWRYKQPSTTVKRLARVGISCFFLLKTVSAAQRWRKWALSQHLLYILTKYKSVVKRWPHSSSIIK